MRHKSLSLEDLFSGSLFLPVQETLKQTAQAGYGNSEKFTLFALLGFACHHGHGQYMSPTILSISAYPHHSELWRLEYLWKHLYME